MQVLHAATLPRASSQNTSKTRLQDAAAPWPGVIEVALGVLLAVPATRSAAAWGIIALLVAVFPANVYAATQGIPGTGGHVRLPLQAVFIA